jgi:hypothetical protein
VGPRQSKNPTPALPEVGEGVHNTKVPHVSIQVILLPVFMQVALTFVLLFMTRSGGSEIRFKDEPGYSSGSAKVASAYNSQFQLPVLFYVVVALAYLLHRTDFLFVMLSFGFVAMRIAHAFIMVTSNDARLRYGAFAAGLVLLAFMWISFAVNILLAF